eukprot:5387532-Amphidinium_carterae.1
MVKCSTGTERAGWCSWHFLALYELQGEHASGQGASCMIDTSRSKAPQDCFTLPREECKHVPFVQTYLPN